MFGDEAVDYGVEANFGTAKFYDAGDGEVENGLHAGEGDEEVVEVHDGVDLVVDAADVVGDFGVEEGAGDDLEREGHHGGANVDGLAGLPLVAMGGGADDDLVAVGGDALAMKGWRGDAALTDVDGVVGGDEAFAEEDLHAADGALFDEGGGLSDEDFANVVGVVNEDDRRAHEAVVGDVAISAEKVLEEENGAAKFDPGLVGVEGEGALKAGREAVFVWGLRSRLRREGFLRGDRRGHDVATGAGMREATISWMRVWIWSMEASSRMGMTRLGSRVAISSYFS